MLFALAFTHGLTAIGAGLFLTLTLCFGFATFCERIRLLAFCHLTLVPICGIITTMKTGPKVRPIEERFWAKVEKRGPNDCWEWTGSRSKFGYGRISSGGRYGTMLSAHRVSWKIHWGPIPDGLLVLHKCDTPPCTNPDHLFLGTSSDNNKDAYDKGRHIPPAISGENHYLSVPLTLSGAVRAAYKETPNQKDLAKKFGISNGTVYAILSGTHWSNKGEENLCSPRGTKKRWHKRP